MGSSQDEQRQAAAKAFMESLNQLEQSLQADKREGSGSGSTGDRSRSERSTGLSKGLSKTSDLNSIDPKALEEAVADIEQLMQRDQIQRDQTQRDRSNLNAESE